MEKTYKIILNNLVGVKMSNDELKYVKGGTITCDAPNPYGGRCYDMDQKEHTCYFSGFQSDYCYYG